MKIRPLLYLSLCLGPSIHAQPVVTKVAGLRLTVDETEQTLLVTGLDSLFSQIRNGKLAPAIISPNDSALNRSIFFSFRGIESAPGSHKAGTYGLQVINCYPIADRQYTISIACQQRATDTLPALKAIVTLMADTRSGHAEFATPLTYLTRNWQKKEVGNITYYYEGAFHDGFAKAFDRNNSKIAGRLGMEPEKLRFYLCDNYQVILQLLGYTYDWEANGRTRDGFGISSHTIFSVMHNEDFSHDTFHYYAAKVRGGEKRNSTAEEGLAYSWGNAYYTDPNGQMISQAALVRRLAQYLEANPTTSLWALFNTNPKLFNDLAKEISVKSVISGVLCDEAERQKGKDGVRALITCGAGDANYLRVINDLIGIDQENFDVKVKSLLNQRSN